MGTLTALMDASRNALMADQTAINVTAQNISNQNTEGYARRIVTWQSADSVDLNGMSIGYGVNVAVTTLRDRVLDSTVQQQAEVSSASSTRLQALGQLGNLFKLDSTGQDASGISTAMSNLFNTASALASNGSDPAARQAFLGSAQTLAGSFNRASASIVVQISSLNQQVQDTVTQVNQLATQFAAVNGKIVNAGRTDTSALEDQRQALLGQLSQLIGTDQVRSDNNSISLTLGNGTTLVSGSEAHALTTAVVSGRTNVVGGDGTNLTGTLQGGSLGGTLQARDQDVLQAAHSLDLLAFAVGSAVNAQNAAGVDANGNTGGNIFNLNLGAPTASAMRVLLTDPNGIAARSTGEGVGGGSNAAAIAALQSQGQAVLSGQNPADNMTSFLSGLGSTIAAATADSRGNAAVLSQVQSQRDALSGVSLDQEAANLTQFQRSYQASAKVLAIVNDLLAAAINLGTPTSVS